MTIAQITGFLKAIAVIEMEKRIAFITDTAVAAQSDGKTIKKTVKTFQKIHKELN